VVDLAQYRLERGRYDFTGADFAGWCEQVGFKETQVLPLAGPTSAATHR
jgi:hypothetical protein